MKQHKWLRHAAKALVLAMVLSLTLCVTAHANVVDDLINEFYGGKDGFDKNTYVGLVIWGFEGDATVSWNNGTVSKPYSSHVNVPGMREVTVTFDGDLQSVNQLGDWTKDGTFITDVDLEHDSFTFVCFPVSGSQSNFTVKVVDRDSDDPGDIDDPTDPGKTDPTDPGKTDPSDPGKTDPSDPGKTDPSDPGKTDPSDPGKTDPSNPGKTDPSDPGKTDPSDPGKTDPSDPGKTDPSDPSDPANSNAPADPTKPSTGDTMLIALWAVVLMGTAVGITALVRSKKRT